MCDISIYKIVILTFKQSFYELLVFVGGSGLLSGLVWTVVSRYSGLLFIKLYVI